MMTPTIRNAIRTARFQTTLADAGITVETLGTTITCTGDTYPIRAALSAAGFSWAARRNEWVLVTGSGTTPLRIYRKLAAAVAA